MCRIDMNLQSKSLQISLPCLIFVPTNESCKSLFIVLKALPEILRERPAIWLWIFVIFDTGKDVLRTAIIYMH